MTRATALAAVGIAAVAFNLRLAVSGLPPALFIVWYRVIPGMTVIDNLRLGGYLMRRRADLERAVEKVTTLFPVHKLSMIPRRVASSRIGESR